MLRWEKVCAARQRRLTSRASSGCAFGNVTQWRRRAKQCFVLRVGCATARADDFAGWSGWSGWRPSRFSFFVKCLSRELCKGRSKKAECRMPECEAGQATPALLRLFALNFFSGAARFRLFALVRAWIGLVRDKIVVCSEGGNGSSAGDFELPHPNHPHEPWEDKLPLSMNRTLTSPRHCPLPRRERRGRRSKKQDFCQTNPI
jgi:hypothetical protein